MMMLGENEWMISLGIGGAGGNGSGHGRWPSSAGFVCMQRQLAAAAAAVAVDWLHAELGAKHQSKAMLATFLTPHCIQNIAYIS